ncbi:coiled-coil domain-containing protein 66-like isoform X2 [Ptychodera flava]|uniref:coiled-coil domain-containing protein 66-like isoform X2 n=1 Tax=Ptychodera flava TaxID=63121 RepID=UPI00396A04E6
MNTGEGLRIAALAKQGSAGIYLIGDPDPPKKKKFSYKKKAQKFPIRKTESRVENPPPKPAPRTTIAKKDGAAESKNKENNENVETEKKKPEVDFIKKNALSVRKGKESKNSKKSVSRKENDGKKDSDTVTLTKEQLQAILAAIGTSAQLEASLAVKGSDKSKGEAKSTEKDNEEKERPASKQEEKKDTAVKDETAKTEEKTESKDDVKTAEETSKADEASERSKTVQSRANQKTRDDIDDNYTAGMGNIGSVIGTTGFNDKSLAERKRLQWKQELDEQVALKKKEQETRRSVRRSHDKEMQQAYSAWDPFGKAGAGAPNKNYTITTNEYKPEPQARQSRAPTTEPVERGAPSRGQYTPDKVPAAMRSSFVLGEGSPREHYHSATKRQERQQWLEELEKQRQEVKERKEREKRERLGDFKETWADKFDTIRGLPQNPRYHAAAVTQTVDDAVVKTTATHREPELDAGRAFQTQSKSAPQTADPSYNKPVELSIANPNNAASEIIHARGRGHQSLMDPTEKERLDKMRQKQLEHQMAIKAQVEEKLRLKREEEERKRREEMEEERKLALERAELQSRFQADQLKQKQKEEELDRKTKALMLSMQIAQEQAAQERHARRMQHLIDGGHDVHNLQKSWDAHHSPNVSPRGMALPQEKFSPRAGVVDPSILTQPPLVEEDFRSVHKPGGDTSSPVKEQAIQTEVPYLNTDGLPPHLERIAREDSAGVEFKFKPKQKPQSKPNRTGIADRSRSRVKEVKPRKVARTPSPVEEKPKRRYKKLSERPQWGKPPVDTKKVKKASEKDLTLDKAKKEERLRKRQQELLLLQEMNAPDKLLVRDRSSSPPVPAVRSRLRTLSPDGRSTRRQEYNSPEGRSTRHRSYSPEGRRTKQYSRAESPPLQIPDSPPLKTGDFTPFVRSEAIELNPDSVPHTPQQNRKTYKPKQRRNSVESLEDRPLRKEKKTDQEMDPLLNPDRLKDKENRQEMILKQLSHLRQGLIMKQRELEVGLTPFHHQ